jgi:hypothetical protein
VWGGEAAERSTKITNSEHESGRVESKDESSDGEEGEGTMGFSPVNIGENKGREGDRTKAAGANVAAGENKRGEQRARSNRRGSQHGGGWEDCGQRAKEQGQGQQYKKKDKTR